MRSMSRPPVQREDGTLLSCYHCSLFISHDCLQTPVYSSMQIKSCGIEKSAETLKLQKHNTCLFLFFKVVIIVENSTRKLGVAFSDLQCIIVTFYSIVFVSEVLPGFTGPAALAGRSDRHEGCVVPHVAQVEPAQLPLPVVAPLQGELTE